ncbi:enoyl-CoA hydratase/isomerase family protein [Aliiglaciecola sp. LCG003]|uniref:enoyl-CoA hydratase/isomerase family protein n=1 Tax=Aliiglaciecola sp. LCG003 TaxID=3053655 RepID=UPI0025728C61|nr:enoyl-CoA hydratase/isomerase family protein [Aliiglaciecola sp. LCG003]WJG10978.1 enoyl-CoA hydratase/isomerase family protein [Aliiglaciecola sp. LCG003]
MTQAVLFDQQSCRNGQSVGIATLNKPRALNALDLEMVNLLSIQLLAWQQNPDVAMVVIDSRGDKAFCAGGDVVSMYRGMRDTAGARAKGHQQSPESIPPSLQTFFSQEYRLDYLIHTFGKPILVWGNGIIMGGGLGLMAGASHRVVTESSRIAMPEVSIGLFPDVGGSWFLNKMPSGFGRFLGTTGASIDADDALFVGLADHRISHQDKSSLLNSLKQINWSTDTSLNSQAVTKVCEQYHAQSQNSMSNLQRHQAIVADLNRQPDVVSYVRGIAQLDVSQDKWLSKAQQSVEYGSAITLHLVHEQLVRGKDLSLEDCFKMELTMACRCASFGEFQEGVRALLIDKDRKPKWTFNDVVEVDASIINDFFVSPWPANQHPLEQLGEFARN